jgi:pyruvate dehydrogenase E2 component (dihydrolipoamide acetyltransferase)
MSPKARRLAREHGIDVTTIKGTGSAGEVLAADVLRIADVPNGPSIPNAPNDSRVSTAGRLMAERTAQSWTSVPHFFVTRDVDATALNAAREQIVDRVQASHGVRVTHTDLIVAAVARALRQHPRMNGSWSNGTVALNSHVNVALAMAVENAVVTAVVADTDRRSIGDIARLRRELADRARANRLQPSDISGATFTISNLGMFAVDAFTAIIVPPQAGILAVGAISERVVAVDGLIGVKPMMTVTLSADHRAIDGAGAAAFLNDVVLGLQELGKWL